MLKLILQALRTSRNLMTMTLCIQSGNLSNPMMLTLCIYSRTLFIQSRTLSNPMTLALYIQLDG
jgi:hypothetical protein